MEERTKEYWVKYLGLRPHPEGGFYAETYRSKGVIKREALPDDYSASRNYGTAIYFLLTDTSRSAFHRLASDELWFFHTGAAIHIHLLNDDGEHSVLKLGSDLEQGMSLQAIIPRNTWFAAEVIGPEDHGLVSCTVSPGFDFADFILANPTVLSKQFPHHIDLLQKFSPK